jgi:hypothetical protein
MSRRPQRELELLPHHVYKHFGAKGVVIYVGMTSDPSGRPTDTKRRPWIKTESKRIEVSPAMPYEAAAWVERSLIRVHNPKHNTNCGPLHIEKRDWRIDRMCEVEGLTVTQARWWVTYFPIERVAFEAALEAHMRSKAAADAGIPVPATSLNEALEAFFGPVENSPTERAS